VKETMSEATIELDSSIAVAPKCSNVNNNNSARSSRVGSSASGPDSDAECQRFGWCGWNPAWLQRFCTAKWALFWLCWGGALQGDIFSRSELLT